MDNNLNEKWREIADSVMTKCTDFRIISGQNILDSELRDGTTIQKIEGQNQLKYFTWQTKMKSKDWLDTCMAKYIKECF